MFTFPVDSHTSPLRSDPYQHTHATDEAQIGIAICPPVTQEMGAPILSPREPDSRIKFLGAPSAAEASETVNGVGGRRKV